MTMTTKTMRLAILQHVVYEEPGFIETWARSHHYEITKIRLFAGDALPQLDSFDWLVVLGGPMGVYDEPLYPWLKLEKQLLRDCLDAGKLILGVCLGAQMLAEVLGAKVERNREREMGWHPVTLSDAARAHPLFKDFPAQFTPLHLHGDCFTAPPGTTPIGASEACSQQGFIWKNRAIGLQFHIEFTEYNVRRVLKECGNDFGSGPYVQTPAEVLNPQKLQSSQQLMSKLLEKIVVLYQETL